MHLPLYQGSRNVGVEVEVESTHVTRTSLVNSMDQRMGSLWRADLDEGSLRGGRYGWEVKAANPMRIDTLNSALRQLYPVMGGSTGNWRAAVHVHVDVSRVRHYAPVFALAYIYDDVIFEQVSPERRESNFCVPLTYNVAEAQMQLRAFMGGGGIIPEYCKYRSVNVRSIDSFGSIEFRHMRTPETDTSLLSVTKALDDIEQFARLCSNIISIGASFTDVEKMFLALVDGEFKSYLPPYDPRALVQMMQANTNSTLSVASGVVTPLARVAGVRPRPQRRVEQLPEDDRPNPNLRRIIELATESAETTVYSLEPDRLRELEAQILGIYNEPEDQ